jgi:bifunctional non-homologous end joining protein LigD
LKRGNLKFSLDGVKLKGGYALVRTRGPAYGRAGGAASGDDGEESRTWLLIKHQDDWSGDVDVTEVAPLSVKSFGDFAAILAKAGEPKPWRTSPPARGGAAGTMLARVRAEAAQSKTKRVTKSQRSGMVWNGKPASTAKRSPRRSKTS